MRDLILLVILVGLCWIAWHRPWIGVVALAFVGAMHPQSFGGALTRNFPFYKLLFVVTLLAFAWQCVRERNWPTLHTDWRLWVLAAFCVQMGLSTWHALLQETARARLVEVLVLMPPIVLALVSIDRREKLHALIAAIALGVALVAVKGGWWALINGFADRVYGPPQSQIGGNNEFAVALAMTLPLLLLCYGHARTQALRWVLAGLIGIGYVSALTSWSRGGLVALLGMTALVVWHSRHRMLALALVGVGVALATLALPEAWQMRMESFTRMGEDASFQGRVDAWRIGLAYVEREPWFGGGFDSWRYLTAGTGATAGMRDWHSAYIELLAEHGIPGLLLWATLIVGTLVALTRQLGRARRAGDTWAADASAMLRAALVAYLLGAATLGIATWELLFLILTCAILLARLQVPGNSAAPRPISADSTTGGQTARFTG